MKKNILVLSFLIASVHFSFSQTNIFPSAGNVGIGTTSPNTALDVQGSTSGNVVLNVQNNALGRAMLTLNSGGTSTTNLSFLNQGASKYTILSTSSGALGFYDEGSLFYSMFIAPASGNVGIGTTSPDRRFTIQRASNISNTELCFKDQGGNTQVTFGVESATTNDLLIAGTAGMRFFTGSGIGTSGVPSNEVMRIKSNGNVGIGTTTPGYPLTVAGSSSFGTISGAATAFFPTTDLTAIGTTPNLWVGARGNINDLAQIGMGYMAGINPSVVIGHKETDPSGNTKGTIFFATRDVTTDTAPAERMTITSAGNVGIGTSSPGAYMLAVNGNVHARQVNVDATGWSDYVFNQNYILPTLTEVKIYIGQNHHLPGIPSEQQMIKIGLNLGEMNKLLVKKVEELTLYLIQNDKIVKDQSGQLKSQQEQINRLQEQLDRLLKSSGK